MNHNLLAFNSTLGSRFSQDNGLMIIMNHFALSSTFWADFLTVCCGSFYYFLLVLLYHRENNLHVLVSSLLDYVIKPPLIQHQPPLVNT